MDNFERKWGWVVGLVVFIPLYIMPAIYIQMPIKVILGGTIVFFIINLIVHHFLIHKS